MMGNEACKMIFASTNGHIKETKFEKQSDNVWNEGNTKKLLSPETVVVRSVLGDKIDVENKLRDEAKKCKWLVLWFDNDPEGEYIAYEVHEICVQQNYEIIVKRARFSSLNPTAVDATIKTSLDDLNPCLLDAVAYRKEVDFKTGRVWTRFQSFLARKQIPNATNLTLSYGLCQSALLGIVVERFNQVAKPKAQKYNISFNDRGYGPKVTFTSPVWYDAKSKASKKLQSCSDEKATIVEVFVEITNKFNKFHSPPVPLTTMELEKLAAKYFKMTPKQTMNTAEDLYTQGFINYPRTETDGFSMN
ncbi:putative DNA topoisomerase [Medicago truncatula]|uniref:DNA topoisomerase n=1 Tax=Medicago truncatula TaxID=3880 RepID=G7KA30_MEDTR|nr:DNA topoisomerase I [Medicago truncatula]RHN56062.1 putative DNA topoisomerase [Medicago truncatula]